MATTRGTTTCMLSNYEELVKTLDNIAGVDAEKVIKKCTSDAKSRAQAWVSAAVCEVYAIKKADVKAALDGKGKGGGQLKVEGNLVESVVLTYKGRVLTPTHFKMKPTQRKPKPYRVRKYSRARGRTCRPAYSLPAQEVRALHRYHSRGKAKAATLSRA